MSHAATTDFRTPDGPTRSVGSGDGFGTFWLRGLCWTCAPLRYMQRRLDVPPARAFSHKRYICVECGSACCEEPIEAYEPLPNIKAQPDAQNL